MFRIKSKCLKNLRTSIVYWYNSSQLIGTILIEGSNVSWVIRMRYNAVTRSLSGIYVMTVTHSRISCFQTGWYGPDCRFTCQPCDAHAYPGCDPVSGRCLCSDGFTGPLCDRPCPSGTYGRNCSQTCRWDCCFFFYLWLLTSVMMVTRTSTYGQQTRVNYVLSLADRRKQNYMCVLV